MIIINAIYLKITDLNNKKKKKNKTRKPLIFILIIIIYNKYPLNGFGYA